MASSTKEFDYGESYPRPIQGVERVSFLRRSVWHNAGFGSLRRIRTHIVAVEPRFVPTVYPHDVPGLPSRPEETAAADPASTGSSDATNEEDCTLDPILTHCSVAQFRKAYLTGKLTPLAVVKALLPLIRRDISPPGIHSTAWIDVKVDLALQAAEASTLRYRNKRSLGPLDGVPAAVKDQYDVEGYVTTLGSAHDFTRREGDETYTSSCVQKLQDAGAIIVGKLNMHEFAADTSGINTTYGTPRNPYNKAYYTGGSSSGSAYAVAVGLVPITLGTDGGGSIRIPASFCSVYGLKPSHGRLSYLPGVNQNSTCERAASRIGVPACPELARHALASVRRPGCHRHRDHHHPYAQGLGVPEAWFDRAEPAVQDLCRSMIGWLVKNKGYAVVPIEIRFLVEGETAHALTVLSHTATALPEATRASPAVRIMLALGRETGAGDYILAQKLRQVLMQHLAWLWRERHPGMLIVTPTTAGAGWPIRDPGGEMG
ncbi:amidase [Apiospora aurea]|uniref:Amidase n=1 Tax=Apiospora aurea TaxID=335848 RepID=A0ABR1Q162_9PEZI